ncbi:ATP-binding protein [Paraburkholderia sediminicola]|nr:ATP-binding protein [Paraburkholderia sediminicola]
MRPIQSLVLENFRGFTGRHTIDLDADLILISGKNGVGKTSILFALDMLLNGQTTLLQKIGPLLTKDKDAGMIAITGEESQSINLATEFPRALHGDLLERAHFFFPDTTDSPESATDIVSILAPQAGLGNEIRSRLQLAQEELARLRAALPARAADVEGSRRSAAKRFEKALEELDTTVLGWEVNLRDGQRLLLTGGNLANHWQSQLRNLLVKLEVRSEIAPNVASGIAGTLQGIAAAISALRDEVASGAGANEPTSPETLSALATHLSVFDYEKAIEWMDDSPKESLIEGAVLFPSTDSAERWWLDRIDRLKSDIATVDAQRRESHVLRNSLSGSGESLEDVLKQIEVHGEDWKRQLEQISADNESNESMPLRSWLTWTSEQMGKLRAALFNGTLILSQRAVALADRQATLTSTLKERQDIVAAARLLRRFRNEAWVKDAKTIGELVDHVRQALSTDGRQVSARRAAAEQLAALEFAASDWANTERSIEVDIQRARASGLTEQPEKIVSEAESTVKRALARDGVFSLSEEVNGQQFRDLLVTLNRLLMRFHFPRDFLPIDLKPSYARGKSAPTYSFVSRAGVEYKALSTGQKAQLAMCWSVCLSYALREKLTSRVIGFDDFTTALDMGQLIPAAGILRQLAYGNSAEYQRQVIVTSHHEDLTNRLVDYLLPPPGKSMRVIEIDEWTIHDGPTWNVYNAKMSRDITMPDKAELGRWLRTQMNSRTRE